MEIKEYRNPVNVLHFDAIRAFLTSSNCMFTQLHEAISKGLLNEVIIDNSSNSFKTPSVNLETKVMQLHESHLSYLWTVCYFLTSVREITFERATSNGIIHLNDSPKFDTLICLLEWGRSLKTHHCSWPIDMPDPTHPTDTASNANLLYIYALQYLMYHEVGHFVLHYDAIDFIKATKNPFYELTKQDVDLLYNMETEADNYAFDCMSLCDEEDNIKFLKHSGAVVAHLSNFYLLSEPDIRGYTHPDLDRRLRCITEKIEIQSKELSWGINHLYATGIQLFFCINHIEILPKDLEQHSYEDWNEIGSDLYNILDLLKKDYQIFKPYKEYLL